MITLALISWLATRRPATFTFLTCIPGADKLGHFLLFGCGTAAVLLALPESQPARLLGTSAVAVLVLLEELLQLGAASRTFSLLDLSASLAGVAVACLLLRRISPPFPKSTPTHEGVKMSRKRILITLLAAAYQQEREFAAQVPEEQRSSSGTFESWSPKDILAHNAYWKNHLAANLQSLEQNKPPQPAEDFNHQNEMIFKQYRSHPWEGVLATSELADTTLRKALHKLSEEELEQKGFFPWLEDRPLWRYILGTAYLHPIVHLAEYYQSQGESDQAGELLGEFTRRMAPLDDSAEFQGTVQYNLACHYALLGHSDRAVSALTEALQLNPELRDWAPQDPDLESIHDHPAFGELME